MNYGFNERVIPFLLAESGRTPKELAKRLWNTDKKTTVFLGELVLEIAKLANDSTVGEVEDILKELKKTKETK